MKSSNHTHRSRAEGSGKPFRPRWQSDEPSRDDPELEHLLTEWGNDLRAQADATSLPSRASLLKRLEHKEEIGLNGRLKQILRRTSSG